MGTQGNNKVAGALFFAAGTQFLIVTTIAESLYPNYSARLNFLSDLGAADQTALLWNTSLFLLGALFMIGAYRFFRGTGKRTYLVVFLLAGIGPIIVAIFREGTIVAAHDIGELFAFLFGGVSAILSYRLTRSPFRYFAVILGAIGLVSLAFYVSGHNLGLGIGGMERMVAYPVLLWLVSFGGYLMSNE